MQLELVTLDGVKFRADAYAIVLPTAAGEITVLAGHEALLTSLIPGVITIRKSETDAENHWEHYATYGGVAEIGSSNVRVLVDEATHGDEINEAEAERARAEADKLLAAAKDQVELDKAQQIVDRQAVRLQVAGLKRRHQR